MNSQNPFENQNSNNPYSDSSNYNPYQAPSSNIRNTTLNGDKLTVDQAIERGYDFDIGEVISEGWAATDGFKLNYFLASLLMLVILFPVYLICAFIPVVGNVIASGVTGVLATGLIIMTLNKLRNQEVQVGQLFSAMNLFGPIILASLLTGLFTVLGLLLLIIPGVYLALAYSFTNWIIADHPGIGFWEAMEGSRKLISQHWFKFLGLGIVLGLINFVGALLLGIGLIWTAPLSSLAIGRLYQKIFEA